MAVWARWMAGATVVALFAAGVASARGRVRRYEIAERSMEPALFPGDYVIALRRRSPPRRGEVVVFDAPGRHGFATVKRIIGLPGETIEISAGRVRADGVSLAEPWAGGPTRPDGRWELGGDEVFVLGDRRAVSAGDGRSIGPLPTQAIPWRVTWRYWPLSRAGRI